MKEHCCPKSDYLGQQCTLGLFPLPDAAVGVVTLGTAGRGPACPVVWDPWLADSSVSHGDPIRLFCGHRQCFAYLG